MAGIVFGLTSYNRKGVFYTESVLAVCAVSDRKIIPGGRFTCRGYEPSVMCYEGSRGRYCPRGQRDG